MSFLRSNAIALVALFIALGSTATAAIVVTGADIKNGSVTSADIKDGSLLAKDIKKSERAKLGRTAGKGKTGPTGAAGRDGAKGDTGPSGATGAQGLAGATGAAGTAGARGEDGADGAAGTNGTNGADGWNAYDAPPSGRLFTGGGVFSGNAVINNQLFSYTQLPFALSAPLDDDGPGRNLFFGGDDANFLDGETSPSCGGTAASPNPNPGVLCVYVAQFSNVRASTEGVRLHAGIRQQAGDAAERNGFLVDLQAYASGVVHYAYVWAYEAP